jgi:D-amino-acid dehydrogenase
MDSRHDVLIVGGGAIGLACALYLLKAGRGVTVLERDRIGQATSLGNCGTLTPSHALPLAAPGMVGTALKWMFTPDAPLYLKPRFDPGLWRWLLRFASRCNPAEVRRTAARKGALLLASRKLIEQLVLEHALDCDFGADGLHYVFRDPRAFAHAQQELPLLAELGIGSRLLDPATLAADEPALQPGMAGAIHFPGDAHLRPDRYTAELARVVRDLGGRVVEECEVQAVATEHGRVAGVRTARGIEAARDVLLALGPWTAAFARQLGLRLPIQPGKGYSITYDRPGLAPRRPLVLRERSVCVTTWRDGFRLGSTMEFSGYDVSLNRRRLAALERGAREYLREPVGPTKRLEWYGWRPMTWDDLPILDRAPGHANLWLACGHGMMGMGMSAVSGQLIAGLMTGRDPPVDPSPCSIARFG